MDERSRRKMLDILRVLGEADRPLGGTRVAQALALAGGEMSQRTIRYYLSHTDREGLTAQDGRRGRFLTERGRQELEQAYVADKVGFIAAKVDALTYGMRFKLRQAKGEVVVNLSGLAAGRMHEAARVIRRVFEAGLSMGKRLLVAPPGTRLGKLVVPSGEYVVATICSISVNGVLLAEGIPASNRFGGLLQVVSGKPARFTQIITYEGTTLDPLEIFIKGQMTSVTRAATTGDGVIGASFREIPAPAATLARRLSARMEKIGLGGFFLIGRPSQPLLEIPVSPGRVGLVVIGGLNPMAAVEEAGIATTNRAMGAMMPFELLKPYQEALAEFA